MKIALRRSEALVPMRWGVGPFRRLRRGRLTRVTTLCRSRGKNSFLIASERTVGIATHRLPHGVHCRICTSITPGRLTVTPTGEKRHSDERPCAGRFRSVQFDCGADEFLQRRLIDLVVFVNIDGVPCISVRHHRLACTKSSTARSLSLSGRSTFATVAPWTAGASTHFPGLRAVCRCAGRESRCRGNEFVLAQAARRTWPKRHCDVLKTDRAR